jgi:hypothetical protein
MEILDPEITDGLSQGRYVLTKDDSSLAQEVQWPIFIV